MRKWLLIGALFLVPMLGLVFVAAMVSNPPPLVAVGQLKPGVVPPEYEAWVIKAGAMCPQVSPALIAGQIEVESNWNPNAASSTGAQGLSQFEPYTWPSWGRDEDGKGSSSPLDPPDSIMAQGRYDCSLAAQASKDLASGRIHGDLTDAILVGYNCGYGCVLSDGGGSGTSGGAQSEGYPGKVKAAMAHYLLPGSVSIPAFVPGGPFGANAVAAAVARVGTRYAYGGGTPDGPSEGEAPDVGVIGFDCSGLMLYAYAQASGHTLILPHLASAQLHDPRGRPVPLDQLQPGDALFPAGPEPEHVVMYVGGGNVVAAPESGELVKIQPMAQAVGSSPSARRFG